MFLPVDEFLRKMRKLYNKNPREWRVYINRDPSGLYNIIVHHENTIWHAKVDMVNPYKFEGYVVKLRPADIILPNCNYTFGLRPISPSEFKKILLGDTSLIMRKIKSTPVPINEVKGPFIEGPAAILRSPLRFVSEKQEELNRKLTEEVDKLIRRKYPERFRLYV